ncbi:alpha/beta hydrolase family esterase [Streptomyces physcomitrii]|uniref:Polyhydroxybutyrate depolymerase n=1 Tax=Streptomyces physcomitrii TaxID=2724184 RepID=A0ABX1H559_9ACTN|nr:PHB depolymerase family esterase [Streptomyces physcomitrii]NKI42166.1 hypothetical protein [Streptomyces physcomitrii]
MTARPPSRRPASFGRLLATPVLATGMLGLLAWQAAPASSDPASGDRSCVRSVPAGDTTVDVPFEGRAYGVAVHVPDSGGEQRPLVVNLHGSQSKGTWQLDYTGMRAASDAHGFLLAAPDGVIPAGDGYAWNVPGVTEGAPRDDIRFLDQAVDTLSGALCADPARIYFTGYSGGGRMASALACERSEKIAAVAPVAGLRAGRPDPADDSRPDPASCAPARAVPVIAFHGEQDGSNPYFGGGTGTWRYSVPAAQERWAELNGCTGEPATEQLTAHVRRVSATEGCRDGAEVLLHDIADGGHTWPGAPQDKPENGHTNREIDADELMWSFFEKHPLPGA